MWLKELGPPPAKLALDEWCRSSHTKKLWIEHKWLNTNGFFGGLTCQGWYQSWLIINLCKVWYLIEYQLSMVISKGSHLLTVFLKAQKLLKKKNIKTSTLFLHEIPRIVEECTVNPVNLATILYCGCGLVQILAESSCKKTLALYFPIPKIWIRMPWHYCEDKQARNIWTSLPI